MQLKKLFPSFCLALPPKRWFKDNYDEEFLDKRQIGLQTFLQKLTLHKDVISRCVLWHSKVWFRNRTPPCLICGFGSFCSPVKPSETFCVWLTHQVHLTARRIYGWGHILHKNIASKVEYCLVISWLLFWVQAFCETLEETNHHLQMKLSESQREFDILKRTLEEKEYYISLLVKKAK